MSYFKSQIGKLVIDAEDANCAACQMSTTPDVSEPLHLTTDYTQSQLSNYGLSPAWTSESGD